jgi:hypothetical protein
MSTEHMIWITGLRKCYDSKRYQYEVEDIQVASRFGVTVIDPEGHAVHEVEWLDANATLVEVCRLSCKYVGAKVRYMEHD